MTPAPVTYQHNGKHKRLPKQVWEMLRQTIFHRDHYACVYCGATTGLELDHRIPLHLGGSNEPENLQSICADCNRRKGRKLPGEWKQGRIRR